MLELGDKYMGVPFFSWICLKGFTNIWAAATYKQVRLVREKAITCFYFPGRGSGLIWKILHDFHWLMRSKWPLGRQGLRLCARNSPSDSQGHISRLSWKSYVVWAKELCQQGKPENSDSPHAHSHPPGHSADSPSRGGRVGVAGRTWAQTAQALRWPLEVRWAQGAHLGGEAAGTGRRHHGQPSETGRGQRPFCLLPGQGSQARGGSERDCVRAAGLRSLGAGRWALDVEVGRWGRALSGHQGPGSGERMEGWRSPWSLGWEGQV